MDYEQMQAERLRVYIPRHKVGPFLLHVYTEHFPQNILYPEQFTVKVHHMRGTGLMVLLVSGRVC